MPRDPARTSLDTDGLIRPAPPRIPAADREHERMWGFADSAFVVEGRDLVFRSKRYDTGGAPLPGFAPFVKRAVGVPFDPDSRRELVEPFIPPARECSDLLAALARALPADAISTEPRVRLRHGHGHHLEEIYLVLFERLERVPDVVVYPATDEEVRAVLDAAAEEGALVLPYGGGTCVSMALTCPDDARPVVSLDLGRMNRIRFIDPRARTACIEAGAVGRILEEQLGEHGFTLGHEPDSIEFSTLGGWIATNASGMKKNRYGNIEDIVLDVTVVTRKGVVEHPVVVPRASHGLDVRRLVIGSEGLLGVITRATVKVHQKPAVQRYGSLVFPNWSRGVAFLEELSTWHALPASVRLVDNLQFQFGQALKPPSHPLKKTLQRFLLTRIKGCDLDEIVACTLVYEGEEEEQRLLAERVEALAKRFGGFPAGGEAGKAGYSLTFGIAYIRDFLLPYWTVGDSFETSVPWGKVEAVLAGVKGAMERTHRALGLPGHPFITARVSQLYQTGCCMYFYIGFHYRGVADPLAAFRELEHQSRLAILEAGGSVSHHHGIGRVRASYLERVKSEAALGWIDSAQGSLDPEGLFRSGNQGLAPR